MLEATELLSQMQRRSADYFPWETNRPRGRAGWKGIGPNGKRSKNRTVLTAGKVPRLRRHDDAILRQKNWFSTLMDLLALTDMRQLEAARWDVGKIALRGGYNIKKRFERWGFGQAESPFGQPMGIARVRVLPLIIGL